MDKATQEFLKMVNFLVEDGASRKKQILRDKDPELAYYYACDVIEGPWPKAEPFIMKDPKWAYEYARNVIKGPWPQAEPFIMKDPLWACWYARDVIEGRWPEAEPLIMNSDYKKDYLNLFCQDCSGSGFTTEELSGGHKEEKECSNCLGKGFDPSKIG